MRDRSLCERGSIRPGPLVAAHPGCAGGVAGGLWAHECLGWVSGAAGTVNAVRRFWRLSAFERRLVLEAAVVLGVIRLALCSMSLRTTRRLLGRLVRASDMWRKGDHQALPEPIVRA